MGLVSFTQGDEATISVLTDLDYSTSTETAFKFTKTDGSQLLATGGITHDGVQADGRFKSNIKLVNAESLTIRPGPAQDFSITGKFSGSPLTTLAKGQMDVHDLDISNDREAGFIC